MKHRTENLGSACQRLRGIDDLNHRPQTLLAHSLREPHMCYLIEGRRRRHNVVFRTARNDLFGLTEKGLLVVRKEGRVNACYTLGDLGEKMEGLAVRKLPDASPPADSQSTLDLRPCS